jgi:hypothetical protein
VLEFMRLKAATVEPCSWFSETFNAAKHAEILDELIRELNAHKVSPPA